MSCCGASPGYDEIDEVSRLVAARLVGVPENPARGRLRRRPAGRPGRGLADGGGLCRKAGAAALGVQASVFGAQIRLGKIRRAVRCVLARQARAIALADHGLGEGRQQPVAEKPAGQQVRAGRRRGRDRPHSLEPTMRRRTAPAKAARRARHAPTILQRSISARWPTPSRSGRPTRSRRNWQRPCARG